MSNPFNQIKHGFESAGHNLNDIFNKAGHELDPEHVFNEIKSEIEHAVNQALADLKHAESAAHNNFQHFEETLKGNLNHLLDKAKRELEHDGKKALAGVQHAALAIYHDLQNVMGKLEHILEDATIHAVIQLTLHELQKLEDIIPKSFGMNFPGGFRIDYLHTHEKVDKLVHYAAHPPKGRDQIIDFIFDLLPNELTIIETIDVEVFIVGSSAFKIGPNIVIEGDEVKKMVNKLFDIAEDIKRGDAKQAISDATDLGKQVATDASQQLQKA